MIVSIWRWLTNMELHPHHMYGLACTKTQHASCPKGWLVPATLRSSNSNWCKLAQNSWVPFPNLQLSSNTLFSLRWNRMWRMWNLPLLSRVGCHVLGWIDCQEVPLNSNLPCSFEGWINCSLTWVGGGGPKLLPSCCTWAKLGRKWITTQETLKNPIFNIWRNEISSFHFPKLEHHLAQAQFTEASGFPFVSYL